MTLDVDAITPKNALSILRMLVSEDEKIAKRIRQIMTKLIGDVDPEEVAETVLTELDSLEVEDLWDRSGSTRNGYVDSRDMAYEMVEEALEPILEQLKEYKSLSLIEESKLYFMGVLKGLYLFDKESDIEFRDWAEDVASNVFDSLLVEWKKSCKSQKIIKDIMVFIKENCTDWYSVSLFE